LPEFAIPAHPTIALGFTAGLRDVEHLCRIHRFSPPSYQSQDELMNRIEHVVVDPAEAKLKEFNLQE
jgi:2-polyprenyl-6-methoxyphenol hydroxylase-like FAD-dependent oxidoreductase